MGKFELEEKFEEYREHLLQEAQELSGFLFIYQQLQEMEGVRLEAMRYAPAFFAITKASLLSSLILWTDKLFDRRSQRGFANFLSFVGANLSLFTLSELQRRTGFDEAKMVVREPLTLEII